MSIGMPHKPIRIAHLIYSLDLESGGGGITRFAIELCRSLDQQAYDPTLVCLLKTGTSYERSRSEELNREGLKIFLLAVWDDRDPYHSFLHSLKALHELQKIIRFDILHSHSEFSDIAAVFMKLSYPTLRIIRTVQYGYSVEWRNRPLRRAIFSNFLFPLLYNVEIGVNQQITGRLNNRSVARFRSKQSLTIHNGVSTARFSPGKANNATLIDALGIPDGSPIIGTVGRLVEQKGYIYFIKAARNVLESIPNAYFIIIGDGELSEDLHHLAKSLIVEEHLFFIEPQTKIVDYYSIMSLFVSSSLWEGLPNVLLECMAYGIPVIGTDIPGSNEIIEHGFNGWLVPPGDENALSAGIISLVESPLLRNEFVKNAKSTLTEYAIERIARQYEDVYLKISGDRRT